MEKILFFLFSYLFYLCVFFLLVFSLSMILNNDNDNDNDIESISWKMPEHVLTICLLIAIRKWILWKQDYFLHWYQVPAFNSASSSKQGTNVHNKSSGISVLLSGQPIQINLFKIPVQILHFNGCNSSEKQNEHQYSQ